MPTSPIATIVVSAWLAVALAGPTIAQPAYMPAGNTEGCKGGVWMGYAKQVRNSLGCLLEASGRVNLNELHTSDDWKKGVRGSKSFRGPTDELLAKWAADPSSSLVPRPGFLPLRAENLEFAPTSNEVRARYINPTGGVGLTFLEGPGNFHFRGDLVFQDASGQERRRPISGLFHSRNTGNQISDVIVEAAPLDGR